MIVKNNQRINDKKRNKYIKFIMNKENIFKICVDFERLWILIGWILIEYHKTNLLDIML